MPRYEIVDEEMVPKRCGTCGEYSDWDINNSKDWNWVETGKRVKKCFRGVKGLGECIGNDRRYWHPVGTLRVEDEKEV